MKKYLFCSIFFFILYFIAGTGFAQSTAADYTVQAQASVQEAPPQIALYWKRDTHAQKIGVSRRLLGGDTWGAPAMLPGSDTFFVDNNVQTGVTYEYRIVDSAKSDSMYAAQGFIASGIDASFPFRPGIVELLVDKTYSAPLAPEIDRLIGDLEAEGWKVIRHDANRTDAVPDIQTMLSNDYNDHYTDIDQVRTLFILGHVPVPYSGDIAPDGHTPGNGNHQGAWPADCYYGNFDGNWTDTDVNDTTANDPRNRNIPGDGKFDQDAINQPMNLEVGRVDLYNLPDFALSDTALLRQYLNRDHAFRTGALQVPNRALVNINFGVFSEYDVPGEDAWRNFPPLVGQHNIDNFHTISQATDWFSYLDTAKYLWAFGCGAGYYNSCSGVGTTVQFADSGANAVFYMLFGSFFGDWDSKNNFTRAPLATAYGLASCWVSRPFWFFHPLSMGQTLGYCTKLTQNNSGQAYYTDNTQRHVAFTSDYEWGLSMGGVHVALMGDPTLRMSYISAPPTNLSASIVGGNTVKLSWTAPIQAAQGYNIYRASSATGIFQKINATLTNSPSFTDASPLNDSNIYVVRAASLITTPSGSYYSESGGAMQGINVILSGVSEAAAQTLPYLHITQSGEFIDISLSQSLSSSEHISIVDITGREISAVNNSELQTSQAILPGLYSYRLSTASLISGVYFVRVTSEHGVVSAKFIVTH